MKNSVFKALADPTRREILRLLRDGSRTSGEIAARFASSWPTISRHLGVLRDAELILAERNGQQISYELNDPKHEAKALRLSFAKADAGRQFDILVNGRLLSSLTLKRDAEEEIYTMDIPIPDAMRRDAQGKLSVRFVARPGSVAGGLYGLRLLR